MVNSIANEINKIIDEENLNTLYEKVDELGI